MSDGWLVDPTSGVYVDRINDIVQRLSCIVQLLCLVLTCWREKKTTIRREGQSTEERLEGIVGVDIGILYTESSIRFR